MAMKKRSHGSNTHIRQNRLQNKGHKKRPRGHLIILKGRIHQEDINIINIYAHNIRAPKYMRKTLEDYKKYIDRSTLTLGNFNTSL